MQVDETGLHLIVPKGTILIVGRHAETWWNHKKNFALYNSLSIPARTDDDYDSWLSAVGRIQAVMTGWYIRESYKGLARRESLDRVLLSTSRRSAETWLYMKKLWDVHQGLHTEQIPELTEIKHQSQSSQSQETMTLQDIADEALGLFSHLPETEQRHVIREYLITEMIDRGAGDIAIDHAIRKQMTNILSRRKHKDGENYIEKRASVARFLNNYLALLNGKPNTSTYIVTHGRTYIALLQLLEGFSDERAIEMQEADGPPFPPHVGTTFFQEDGGRLVRRGKEFYLARCLRVAKIKRRLLDFKATPALTPEKFSKICQIASVKLTDPIRTIPKRNAKGIFTCVDYETDSTWPPPIGNSDDNVITSTKLQTIKFER
jgi:broad specificity phosphatase PhoE